MGITVWSSRALQAGDESGEEPAEKLVSVRVQEEVKVLQATVLIFRFRKRCRWKRLPMIFHPYLLKWMSHLKPVCLYLPRQLFRQEAILGTGYCMKSTIANAAISASHETRSFPESGINMQAGSSSVKARVFMKTSRVSHSSAVPDICSMP